MTNQERVQPSVLNSTCVALAISGAVLVTALAGFLVYAWVVTIIDDTPCSGVVEAVDTMGLDRVDRLVWPPGDIECRLSGEREGRYVGSAFSGFYWVIFAAFAWLVVVLPVSLLLMRRGSNRARRVLPSEPRGPARI